MRAFCQTHKCFLIVQICCYIKGNKKIKDDSIVKLDLKNVSNCQLINNTNKITRSFMLVYFT